MTVGVDMAYDSAGLQAGAGGLRDGEVMVDAATAALRAAPLEPVMFALTPSAPGFAAAVETVRAAQARGFAQEAQRAGDLAGRADTAADLGDGLVQQSTSVADSVPAAPR